MLDEEKVVKIVKFDFLVKMKLMLEMACSINSLF
jgi:hypothetical protein